MPPSSLDSPLGSTHPQPRPGSPSAGLLAYLVLFEALFVTPFFLEGGLGLRPRQAGWS
jgi:hypothetical protein